MDLSSFINGGAPANLNTNSTTQQTMPQWYEDYVQGIAGKAAGLASRPYTPYPDQRIAGFTPDTQQAFQNVRNNQGNWQQANQQAQSTVGGVVPGVQGALGQAAQAGQAAQGAVSGPAQSWNNNWQSYMSPYTGSVVNEISRLGNQNLNENLIPHVQDQFLGSGQFGSTRNADILGRTVRDAQTNISGLQSQALQSGYGTSANIFGADANRAQQQQQLQANTGIQAGQLATTGAGIGANAGIGAGAQMGALGQMQQQQSSADTTQLGGIGQMQQGLNQQGLDTSYQDFQSQRDNDWNNLSKLKGAVTGLQLPTGQASSVNYQAPNMPASPLAQLGGLLGLTQTGSGDSSPPKFNSYGIPTSN